MSVSDVLAVWGLIVSVLGLLVTGVGFWVAIVQLRKSTGAAQATKAAVETANKRMLYNHLLVLTPQLRTLEGDLDASIATNDRPAAIRALVAFSHAANQIAALLDTEPSQSDRMGDINLIADLRSTARAASGVKSELVSGSAVSLAGLLQSIVGEISDISARCAGLSTTYQTKVA